MSGCRRGSEGGGGVIACRVSGRRGHGIACLRGGLGSRLRQTASAYYFERIRSCAGYGTSVALAVFEK